MTLPAKLSEFSVIKLTGPDAVSFLQGQVTCDVAKLDEGQSLAGCHCNAKGKMWSTFIIFKYQGDLLLVMHRESAAKSLAELNKYGVFAKTDITDESEQWHVYGSESELDAPLSKQLAADHFISLSSTELPHTEDANLWWQAEILSGRAHLFAATQEEFVPQMLNLQALDYISFNKGCYMGQEMVARMKYLGKNKRALYIGEINGIVSLSIGDDVFIELNGNRRSQGKIINSIASQEKTFVQLVLPKDTELTESIYTSQDAETAITLLPLPYSLEQD